MANFTDKHIMEEGPRNAIVKITGVLDTSNVQLPSVVQLADFVNNDRGLTLTGFRIDIIEFAISVGLEISLWWHGVAIGQGQLITPLAGSKTIGAKNYGGFLPDANSPFHAGYDGSLDLTTANYTPGTVVSFSVMLELVKLYK